MLKQEMKIVERVLKESKRKLKVARCKWDMPGKGTIDVIFAVTQLIEKLGKVA